MVFHIEKELFVVVGHRHKVALYYKHDVKTKY